MYFGRARSDFFCYALETGAKVAVDDESGANEPTRDFFMDESPAIVQIPDRCRANYRQ